MVALAAKTGKPDGWRGRWTITGSAGPACLPRCMRRSGDLGAAMKPRPEFPELLPPEAPHAVRILCPGWWVLPALAAGSPRWRG